MIEVVEVVDRRPESVVVLVVDAELINIVDGRRFLDASRQVRLEVNSQVSQLMRDLEWSKFGVKTCNNRSALAAAP